MKLSKRIKRQFKHRHKHIRGLSMHPYIVPLIIFLTVFGVSLTALVSVNAESGGADDVHAVKVYADGVERTVPTRAQTVGELLNRLEIKLDPQDIVEPAVESLILADNFTVNVYRARPIAIVEDGKATRTTLTAKQSARAIAESEGITVYPEDKITLSRSENLKTLPLLGEALTIDRATPVIINLYGNSIPTRTQTKTVGDLLSERNIQVQEGDTLSPAPETPLEEGMVVVLATYGKQILVVEEAIAPPTETINDANATIGSEVVKEQGKPGRKVVTYEIQTENGQETGRTILQEMIAESPVKRVVAKGTRPLFADYNADGIPARVFCGSPKQRTWKNINVTNAAVGRALAAEKGWTGAEFDALLELFACESSWNHLAGNPYSGAYGIPQSLPASKMASAGNDYLTNPKTQIIWGLGYVSRLYGTPTEALAKHYRSNWY